MSFGQGQETRRRKSFPVGVEHGEKAKGKKEQGNSKNLKKFIMAGGFFLVGGTVSGCEEEQETRLQR